MPTVATTATGSGPRSSVTSRAGEQSRRDGPRAPLARRSCAREQQQHEPGDDRGDVVRDATVEVVDEHAEQDGTAGERARAR